MQKIMFDNRYGLTDAVLRGFKTNTRRTEFKHDENAELINLSVGGFTPIVEDNRIVVRCWDGFTMFSKPARYKVGEVVAVAQSYNDIWRHTGYMTARAAEQCPGYHNKMFVKAERMPHHIRITGIRVQRLQDISDEDCIKEGIQEVCVGNPYNRLWAFPNFHGRKHETFTAINAVSAYAALIDRVSGRGTWDSNPFVVAYEFELID